MHIVMAGSSGFLGTALRDHVARQGHTVTRLVRGDAVSAHESSWDPYAGQVDQAVVDGADVVVNLAGAPIAHWPWTEAYQRTLRDSRVETTATLAHAVARAAGRSGGPPAYVVQNGVAGYGDRGEEVLTEDSSTDADTPLGRITRSWSAAADPAREAGARVAVMRTGVVLDGSGGVLQLMLPVFRLGLGGRIGDGRQYFPTISLTDWCRAATWLMETDSAEGAYNLTAPDPQTNAGYTRELGRLLHRPTALRVPSFPLRKVLGGLSHELLGSVRAEPARLRVEGFTFEHPTVSSQLAAALSPS